MACTGLSITSPDIECLDFLLTWDLSGPIPTVTITNNSSSPTEGGIGTSQVQVDGTNYTVGDICNIIGSAGTVAQLRVTEIFPFPGTGGVASYVIVNAGGGFIPGNIYATTGGTGSGLTIKVLTASVAYENLNWWFYITAPSGAAIHGQDLTGLATLPTPDYSRVNWSPTSYDLPTPFGLPPCGQIEFSPNAPYGVTVFVQDLSASPPTLFKLLKPTIIVRPNGNNEAGSNLPNTCGNFGSATINMQVDCANSQINVSDLTNLTYSNIAPTLPVTNVWTLVTPPAPSGDMPITTVVNDEPNVTFTGTVDSDGYQLYFNEYATYDYGNGITIIIQYKLFDCNSQTGIRFSYNCNTSLCNLMCNLQTLYELSNGSCGTVQNITVQNKLALLTPLLFQLTFALMQPLCGVNVPKLIKQINKVGGFSENCGCNPSA